MIYIFGDCINSTIEEISENGSSILVNDGNAIQIVNLEYVTRIHIYPAGKKKRTGSHSLTIS